MQADPRISVKDYHRGKNLKILLLEVAPSRFLVTMNGAPWPKAGGLVSPTHLFTALLKSFVKSV